MPTSLCCLGLRLLKWKSSRLLPTSLHTSYELKIMDQNKFVLRHEPRHLCMFWMCRANAYCITTKEHIKFLKKFLVIREGNKITPTWNFFIWHEIKLLNYVKMKFQLQVYMILNMDLCTKLCELEVSIITCILVKWSFVH